VSIWSARRPAIRSWYCINDHTEIKVQSKADSLGWDTEWPPTHLELCLGSDSDATDGHWGRSGEVPSPRVLMESRRSKPLSHLLT
jgi:hypothetical protein